MLAVIKRVIKKGIIKFLEHNELTICQTTHNQKWEIDIHGDYVRKSFLQLIRNELDNVEGCVAEVGVYRGGFARLINQVFRDRRFFLFDTFKGFDSRDMDVELRNNLWENVKSLNKQGVTIILTTHYLAEAEETCDRIGILNKGSLVALDSTKNLLKRIQTKIVTFFVNQKVNIQNNSLSSINVITNESNQLIVSYEKSKLNISDLIQYINKQNIKINDISTDDGDLEDVFIRLTKN